MLPKPHARVFLRPGQTVANGELALVIRRLGYVPTSMVTSDPRPASGEG